MTARELSTASILLGIGGSVQQIGNDKWAPWQLLGKREEKKRKPKKKHILLLKVNRVILLRRAWLQERRLTQNSRFESKKFVSLLIFVLG